MVHGANLSERLAARPARRAKPNQCMLPWQGGLGKGQLRYCLSHVCLIKSINDNRYTRGVARATRLSRPNGSWSSWVLAPKRQRVFLDDPRPWCDSAEFDAIGF